MGVRMRYGSTVTTDNHSAYSDTETATETLLWENESPTTARSSINATLSDSLENYDMVRVEYAYNTSSESASFYVVFPVRNDNGDYMFPSGTTAQRMSLGLNNASGNPFTRQFYVSDDTTIHFNNAYRVNTSGSTNTNLIPWSIYGINGGYGWRSSSEGGGSSDIPIYGGQYTVTPSPDNEIVLKTSGTQLLENVTVKKIPYYETSNVDGTTVYIGVPEE